MLTHRFARVSAVFAVTSLTLTALLFGDALAPEPEGPHLAQAGAELAPWLIGLVVVLLLLGGVFLMLGRRKKN